MGVRACLRARRGTRERSTAYGSRRLALPEGGASDAASVDKHSVVCAVAVVHQQPDRGEACAVRLLAVDGEVRSRAAVPVQAAVTRGVAAEDRRALEQRERGRHALRRLHRAAQAGVSGPPRAIAAGRAAGGWQVAMYPRAPRLPCCACRPPAAR